MHMKGDGARERNRVRSAERRGRHGKNMVTMSKYVKKGHCSGSLRGRVEKALALDQIDLDSNLGILAG